MPKGDFNCFEDTDGNRVNIIKIFSLLVTFIKTRNKLIIHSSALYTINLY